MQLVLIATSLRRFAGVRAGEAPDPYCLATALHGQGSVHLVHPDRMNGISAMNLLGFDGRHEIWVDATRPELVRRYLVAREIASICLAPARLGAGHAAACDVVAMALLRPLPMNRGLLMVDVEPAMVANDRSAGDGEVTQVIPRTIRARL